MCYNLCSGDPNAVLGVATATGAFVPADPANPDWRDFLAWRAEGGVPAPAAEAGDTASIVLAARAALQASDRTILRCLEAGVPVPPDWIAYRVALRAVVSGRAIDLPACPDFVPGT